jgi:apolipoprotein N-acyltransferase
MKKILKRHLIIISTLALSITLFSISFPGLISTYGIAYLSFLSLLPMFLVIYKLNYIESFIYGFVFGISKYFLFNYWLKGFDPAAFAVAPAIHGFYFLLLFPLIKYLKITFPKYGFLPILVAWLSYEVFKSTNVVGFSYGLLSHSMYKTLHFTGIADIIGAYLLSGIIVFPSIYISFLLNDGIKKIKLGVFITPAIYIIIFILSIIYTNTSKIDYSASTHLKVTLVQHNLNCWLAGNDLLYSQAYSHLEELSVIGENLDTQLVVWPESAFVPSIEWHKKHRPANERNRLDLINRMENYLSTTKAYYIIGNNESYGKDREINYNTAYLYRKNNSEAKYRKINLVPFTEQFPYPEKFPGLHRYVQDLGAKDMTPGEEQVLFKINDNLLATPLICYEDAFPDLPRQGVLNGSNLLVNITNDAWTDSPSAALQHLAAAAIRTIETRTSLIRSGTSGFTSIIDPNGKIIASLPLFVKDQLTDYVPIVSNNPTIYVKYGHLLDKLPYFLLFGIIILSVIINIRKRRE